MKTGDYVFMIHPKWVELLNLTPKEKWKIKYRGERLAKKGIFEPVPLVEVGSINGFVYHWK